jgi:hypothetical protein
MFGSCPTGQMSPVVMKLPTVNELEKGSGFVSADGCNCCLIILPR